MTNQINVERIYDGIDASCMILYDELKMPYLQGISETCESILSGTPTDALPDQAKTKQRAVLKTFKDARFGKEEVRKAMQLAILKGFKHVRRPNADITPDTIGILIAYLLEKLMKKTTNMVLFDPLVGTGNLLLTVANHLDKTVVPIGVDHDLESFNLAVSMFDMLEYGEGLYFQDTMTFRNLEADAMVTDFPFSQLGNGHYFPYEVIKFHHATLKAGGYFLSVISNDFFELAGADEFHQLITETYQVVGLVKLPDSMFKALGKSILILQKQGEGVPKITKALLADIPSFQNPQAVNEAIKRMDLWFSADIKQEE